MLTGVECRERSIPNLVPGIVGRVCSKLQRAHLAPRTGHNVGSKYGH
jgi:hypothetical protein